MSSFVQEQEGIYRLKIPFDTVYTSVFLVVSEEKRILVDCATTKEDVDLCIVPALSALGYAVEDLDLLVLTHWHDDHAGGRARLLELAPKLEVVREVRELTEGVCTYPMAGHTEDSIGVLDTRTHTLISGDGLQGAGVDKYRCALESKDAYQKTLDRIASDERIASILFSHAYEPWYADSVSGRDRVVGVLETCKNYV